MGIAALQESTSLVGQNPVQRWPRLKGMDAEYLVKRSYFYGDLRREQALMKLCEMGWGLTSAEAELDRLRVERRRLHPELRPRRVHATQPAPFPGPADPAPAPTPRRQVA